MDAKFWAGVLLCCLPLKHLRLNSAYGLRFHPLLHYWKKHAGIDLAARRDTVYAIMDGTVSCRYGPQLGLSVSIDHGNGLASTYGHLSQWLVLPGDTVQMADAIGITGATGLVTGEHLHFAIQYQQHYIDPLQFLWRMVNSNHTSLFNYHESKNQ